MALFQSLSNATDNNSLSTLYLLLRSLNAKVTRASARDKLTMHPDFPSLLSMSDALTDWKIDNAALQLNTAEQLRELPTPFIAHMKEGGGWYVLVTDLTDDKITYVDSSKGQRTEGIRHFEEIWSGVVLVAEANDQSGEVTYARNRPSEIRENLRVPFLLAGSLMFSLLIIVNVAKNFTSSDWLLLVTKSAGISLSGLLVAKQMGSRNSLTDRLCQLNKKTDCDSVLNSPGAKLWGWLSWADIGLVYFAGGLLAILTEGIQSNTGLIDVHPLLNGIALLALPYVIFSVYYQGRVVRQWCTLCLLVQGILVIEAVIAMYKHIAIPSFLQPYVILFTAFLFPVLIWILVKPMLSNIIKSRQEHDQLMQYKRNTELFQILLSRQDKMTPVPNDLNLVALGNPDGGHTITLITNPYCGPCARMHKEINFLLQTNPALKVQIIFPTSKDESDRVNIFALLILSLDVPRRCEALNSWYDQNEHNYSKWASQFLLESESTEAKASVERHGNWCRETHITSTPTLFIDGHRLPDLYDVTDLVWLRGAEADKDYSIVTS